MADVANPQVSLTLGPIGFRVHPFAAVTSVRCFKQDQAFGAEFKWLFGVSPPEIGAAVPLQGDSEIMAVWSRPTEILFVAPNTAPDIDPTRVFGSNVGYVTDLDGQYALLRCDGPRVPSMLSRLGGGNTCPSRGQAKRARLADAPAMVFSSLTDQYTIMIDRSVLEHFIAYATQVCSNL